MPYTQANRLISIKVRGHDDDALLLTGFSGHEAISRLYSFHLDLLSERPYSELRDKCLDHQATISIRQADGAHRYFDGIIVSFSIGATEGVFTRYQAELVPYTWKLTLHADCRIFHNKRVDQILETVLQGMGANNYQLSLTATYDPMEILRPVSRD